MRPIQWKSARCLAAAAVLAAASPAAAQGAPPAVTPPPTTAPAPAPAPTGVNVIASLPLKLGGSVTARYDWLQSSDQTDALQGDDAVNGFRARIRLSATYGEAGDAVAGGVRLSAAESPNPAGSFVSLGDAFRPNGFGLDQYYLSVRPFHDRELLSFSAGKMPLPFWRGDRGSVRSELIWDDDVSPAGVAVNVTLMRTSGKARAVTLDSSFGYFVLHDIPDLRFVGRTGPASLIGGQLRLQVPLLTAAIAYYDYENLNTGLASPSFVPGSGATVTPGQSAFLLRPGLQVTNNHVNVGPGAEAFTSGAFRVVDATVQAHYTFPSDRLGDPELYLLGDFAHNLSVERDRDGYGITAGLRAGAFKGGAIHPANLWLTYRDVDADAALGTFADSDLGAGTLYKGFEIGANYRVHEHLMLIVSYFNYLGQPAKDNQIQRVFGDVLCDF